MTDPPFQIEGPWDRPRTVRFYGGPLSQFAFVAGMVLPVSYEGHPPGQRCRPKTLEHWFNASKTTNEDDFLWVLEPRGPKQAKRRGGPHGECGRRIVLRPGWDDGIKQQVALVGNRAKFALQPFARHLLATGDATLVEWSPTDAIWGGQAADGSPMGQNLLGITLMRVRFEIRERQAGRDPKLNNWGTPGGA
jgi:ribA/ribD-fused uncharacterized protein